jgi:hypothetical protein
VAAHIQAEGEMKLVVLALALGLCACGDGRIERAMNNVPSFYPATTADDDGGSAKIRRMEAEGAAFQRQLENDETRSKVNDVQNQIYDLQSLHPELF